MGAWRDGRRDDPAPCRENDTGLFEVTVRDGRARLGRLHTQHGVLETPALLPVINPNIRTIEPREMWDRYGIGALITNSYIIWKHEELKQTATTEGIHALLDFPGVIMTDSGTFQAYVYGDVEVGVEEIVDFQRSIGVDIATMLDVFSRPDMNEEQVRACVRETIERAAASVHAAQGTMLNGPIQGGLFKHLRTESAKGMGDFDFAIHPIGGIVPVMERHLYKDYAKIMMASIPHLPPHRPVHMFGCGHPMLFPMSIALGADLFDSAAYALFARDGRLLTPWGTQKLQTLTEWPERMPCVAEYTPADVRALGKKEMTAHLARYNLEVTLAELDRCKQAVRDGTIWRLAERRSHQHPALREAFLWLSTSPHNAKLDKQFLEEMVLDDRDAAKDIDQHAGEWENAWNWIVESQESPRKGGEPWGGDDTNVRPHVDAAKKALRKRWKPRTIEARGSDSVLVAYGSSGPWRERLSDLMVRLQHHCPGLEVMIQTPIGLLPYSLEDLNPFTHIDGPQWLWRRRPNPLLIRQELQHFGMQERRIVLVDLLGDGVQSRAMAALHHAGVLDGTTDDDASGRALETVNRTAAKETLQRRHVADKMVVLLNARQEWVDELLEGSTCVVNRLGRVKNTLLHNGVHIVSPRLTDGGLSLTDGGASVFHNARTLPAPSAFERSNEDHTSNGPAWIVVNEDAEPFIRQGRNVFHGFIVACDEWISPGKTCLIVNRTGDLLGHGVSNGTLEDMKSFKKGVAVKTRGGIRLEDQ
ncbi:MAG: tRNA guanosine(15) transglycosylase TgtA [Candidatus Poseidoniaceae archaeon]|nr:tRNA guanosine(15) transglycosylase TgtA [Candidatus Poseidoniaceae archaeon]